MGENDIRAMPSAPATPEPSPAVSALRGGIGIAAHTPGPWVPDFHNERLSGGRYVVSVLKPGDLVPIAAVPSGVEGFGREEGRANARLIAAAPALYEALAGMVRLSEMGFEASLLEPEENGNFAAYERAKAALSLVGGEALASTDRELEA